MQKGSNQLGSRACIKSSKELGKKVCKRSNKELESKDKKARTRKHTTQYVSEQASKTCENFAIEELVNVDFAFRQTRLTGGPGTVTWLAIRQACTLKAMDRRARDGKG